MESKRNENNQIVDQQININWNWTLTVDPVNNTCEFHFNYTTQRVLKPSDNQLLDNVQFEKINNQSQNQLDVDDLNSMEVEMSCDRFFSLPMEID